MSPRKPGDGSALSTDAPRSPAIESQAADKDGRASDSGSSQPPSDKKDSRGSADSQRKAPANYKWVGSQVRRMYDSVLNEPVPKNFTDLLKQAYDNKKTPDKS